MEDMHIPFLSSREMEFMHSDTEGAGVHYLKKPAPLNKIVRCYIEAKTPRFGKTPSFELWHGVPPRHGSKIAKSAAMLVIFVLLELFSIQTDAQAPGPAPVAGGPVPVPPPATPPTPVRGYSSYLRFCFPFPCSSHPHPHPHPHPNHEAPGPGPNESGAPLKAWSGVAVASVIVAAMVM